MHRIILLYVFLFSCTGLASAAPDFSIGDSSLTLEWQDSLFATGYSVKRGPSLGGSYSVIATDVTNDYYIDAPVTNGVTYHYVVTATNGTGESPQTADVSGAAQAASSSLRHAPYRCDHPPAKPVSTIAIVDYGMGNFHSVARALAHAAPDADIRICNQPGQIAAADRVETIKSALSRFAADTAIHDIHNVRVRDTDAGEIVNFHCRAAPSMSVIKVHESVDEIERALRNAFPTVKRVISHAEPPNA